jgi:hypothetical protein
MKYLTLVVLGIGMLMAGCTTNSLEESIGVGPEDNAILVVYGHIDSDLPWANSEFDYCRVEFGKDIIIADITADQIRAMLNCRP